MLALVALSTSYKGAVDALLGVVNDELAPTMSGTLEGMDGALCVSFAADCKYSIIPGIVRYILDHASGLCLLEYDRFCKKSETSFLILELV
jgi:hypothetical protein